MSSLLSSQCRLGRITSCVVVVFATFVLGACADKKPTKPRVAFVSPPATLPKPAPMRVGPDSNSRRKAPLLPKTIVNIRDDSDVQGATPGLGDEFLPPAQSQVVSSATPEFISNEQPQDYFQGVGEAPAGETILGSFFDSVFRPATPANQPVSSATYKVE